MVLTFAPSRTILQAKGLIVDRRWQIWHGAGPRSQEGWFRARAERSRGKGRVSEGVREWKSIREVSSQFQAGAADFRKPWDVVCSSSLDPRVKRARATGRANDRAYGRATETSEHGEKERPTKAPFRTNGVKRLSHQLNVSLLILGRFDSASRVFPEFVARPRCNFPLLCVQVSRVSL